MDESEGRPDLVALVRETQVELLATEVVRGAAGADHAEVAELDYYEAELRSLRDAARSLSAVERRSP